jgi:Tol biopolymer transport system component
MRIVVALGAFAIGIWATHAHGSYRPPELRCGLVAGFGGSAPSFSPDGRRIAFVRPLYDEYAVYTADSNGLRVRRLSEPLREEPHETLWSPRGDLVALLTARSDVAVVDVATGAVRVLARATSSRARSSAVGRETGRA